MPSLLDLLQTGKLHWLTVPRYAVITLPFALASALQIADFGMIAILPLSVSALGMVRLVWLKRLPHEKARLAAAAHALAAAKPDQAISILQQPLPFTSINYQIGRAALLVVAYLRNGQFIEAHRTLNAFNEQSLLPDERLCLQSSWSLLFLEAGNPTEALRRLEGIADRDCIADIGCLLLKAELELQQDRPVQAHALIESGLDRSVEAGERVRLLNNLARIERAQGRYDAQLRHLQAALHEFRRAPRVDLTDIVHHNLAIALVRAGRKDEAREVLREAWAIRDATDLRHAITVLNNYLHTAREAGDADWKREVHEEFHRQLSSLVPRTPSECLAVEVSQLRPRRNDQIPIDSGEYTRLISRLLDLLEAPYPPIPESDRVAALVEIRHDLKQAVEAVPNQAESDRLLALVVRSARQLLDHRPIIDAHLSALSPKLLGPLGIWHRYRTDADKAQIQLADQSIALRDAFACLFSHLREKAEWLSEQGAARQAIEAWLVVCDEYLAYHDQLHATAQPNWRKDYLTLAQHALDKAVTGLMRSQNVAEHVDHMIGVAYFNLRLREDAAAAAHWVQIIEAQKPALEHFAGWLREHYAYVLAFLQRPESRFAPQPS